MLFWRNRASVVLSRVISPLIWVICIAILLITLLIATHEPPSKSEASYVYASRERKRAWRQLLERMIAPINRRNGF